MVNKKVVAKISENDRQKRITIPNQEETKDWKQGDLIKLEKIEVK